MYLQIIGALAALTSTLSLLPQIYKSHKTKSVQGLSLLMIVNFFATSLLWLIYGIMITSISVIVANSIMLLFSIWLLFLSVKYD